MEFLILWFVFAAIVGAIATDRAMGFWGGFLWSAVLSPVIGFIIVICSKSKAQQMREDQVYHNQQQQTNVLYQMQQKNLQANQQSIADEIAKLKKQLDDGVLTEDEFQKLKSKLIS